MSDWEILTLPFEFLALASCGGLLHQRSDRDTDADADVIFVNVCGGCIESSLLIEVALILPYLLNDPVRMLLSRS